MRLRRPITCKPQIGRDRFDAFGLSSSVNGSPLFFSGDFSQTMRPQMLCPHLAKRTAPRPVSSYQMPVMSSAEAGVATNSNPKAAIPAAKVLRGGVFRDKAFGARRADVRRTGDLRTGDLRAEAVGEEPRQRFRNILLISRQVSRSHKRRWGSYDEQMISPQPPLVDPFRNSLLRRWLPLTYRSSCFKASPWQDLWQEMATACQCRHQTQTKAASGVPCTCILYDARDHQTCLDVGANLRQGHGIGAASQRTQGQSKGLRPAKGLMDGAEMRSLAHYWRVWPSG